MADRDGELLRLADDFRGISRKSDLRHALLGPGTNTRECSLALPSFTSDDTDCVTINPLRDDYCDAARALAGRASFLLGPIHYQSGGELWRHVFYGNEHDEAFLDEFSRLAEFAIPLIFAAFQQRFPSRTPLGAALPRYDLIDVVYAVAQDAADDELKRLECVGWDTERPTGLHRDVWLFPTEAAIRSYRRANESASEVFRLPVLTVGRLFRATEAALRSFVGQGTQQQDREPEKCPIVVDVEKLTVQYRGKSHQLVSEACVRWFKILAENPGRWFGPNDYIAFDPQVISPRSGRLKAKLPNVLKKLVEVAAKKGTRLVLPVRP